MPAPTPRHVAHRMVIARAARKGWRVHPKPIYGLRASPKRFSNWLAKMLQPSGWHRTQGEPQLYWSSRYPGALMSIHMDDMFLTAADDDIKKIKKDFLKDLPVKWSNPLDEKWQKFIGGGLRPESFSAVFRRNISTKSRNTGSLASARRLRTHFHQRA